MNLFEIFGVKFFSVNLIEFLLPWAAVWEKGKNSICFGCDIAKSECWDFVVFIERGEGTTEDVDNSLFRM